MRPRTLLLTEHLPWPIDLGGAGQRTEALLRSLAKCSDVEILVLAGEATIAKFIESRESLPPNCTIRHAITVPKLRWAKAIDLLTRWTGPMGKVVRSIDFWLARYRVLTPARRWLNREQRLRPYDLIVSRYVRPAMIAGCRSSSMPAVIDVDDVDWRVLSSRAQAVSRGSAFRRVASAVSGYAVRQWVRSFLRRCDHVWVTNEDDVREAGCRRVSILRNIVHPGFEREAVRAFPSADDSWEILFVGSLGHDPNLSGLDHFVRNIWPSIRATVSEARLTIAGGGADEETVERWSAMAGVAVLGRVAELAPLYARCAFTVAPVYYGGGTNIKILESLSYGRACIVAPHVARGYRHVLPHGVGMWCCKTDLEFIEGCIAMLKDPAARNAVARRGGEIVRSTFAPQMFDQRIRDTVASVLRGRPRLCR